MHRISTFSISCLFLFYTQFSLAQESKTLRTSVIAQEDAPVALTAYKAVFRTFEEGLMTVVYLEESMALSNVSDDPVTAYEIGIVYTDAFGDEIDRVRETVVKEIAARSPSEITFKQPVYYDAPIYSAVAYINRLRLEPDGEDGPPRFWQADSSRVEASLKQLRNGYQVSSRSE